MKTILFIQPPFFKYIDIHSRYFPYHFVSMGTYLKKNGHQVRILEADKTGGYGKLDFSEQELFYGQYLKSLENYDDPFWRFLNREITTFNPDYVGITIWTTFIASAIHTAHYCKKISPNAKIVAGGPHVTLLPDDIKKSSIFDIGVIGEGEETILEILNGNDLESIQGIFYSSNGSIKQTAERPFEKDLDRFGIPDRSLLINKKKYDDEDMGLIMTSRGCPYSCAYCATSIWKKKVRARSIESIVEEIKVVKEKYGTIYFTIKDDSFLVNRKRVLAFCLKLREEQLDINWECNANLRNVDRDLLLEMKSSGCISVKIGIETGSDRVHKIINKGLNNKVVEEKIGLFNKTGIHLTCYFMMGIPGETRDDILQTLEFISRIKPDFISFSVYEIFPGTELHKIGIQNNTAIQSMKLEDYFHVEPHNYYFSDQKRHLDGMPYDEFDCLENYMKKRLKKYNHTPRSILLRAKSRIPLYKKRFSYFSKDVKSFINWV